MIPMVIIKAIPSSSVYLLAADFCDKLMISQMNDNNAVYNHSDG